MRYYGLILTACALTLAALASCGHLPSELAQPKADKKPSPLARVAPKRHTVSCETPSRGFRELRFSQLFTTTEDPNHPFHESTALPPQYDVHAFVWGYDDCAAAGTCASGDHYWLIERGPEGDFPTWVVTPQYPRITIHSNCRGKLKVGEQYRFSFSRGQLVGFSR